MKYVIRLKHPTIVNHKYLVKNNLSTVQLNLSLHCITDSTIHFDFKTKNVYELL